MPFFFFLLVLPKLYCTVRYPLAETGKLVQKFSKTPGVQNILYCGPCLCGMEPFNPALRASGGRRRGSCPIWKERLRSRARVGRQLPQVFFPSLPLPTVSEATPCGLSHITEMTCVSDKPRLLASLISGQMEAYIGMRIDTVLVWRLRGRGC
jgi:hypothetical protein